MPRLTNKGCVLISMAGLIERQLSVPEPVTNHWRYHKLCTGDSIAYDGQKNAKIVLDTKLLRKISRKSKLYNGALLLSDEQWEELGGDDVLYLNAEKVELADGRGFIKKNGVWQPKNTVVGEVWEHLSRGKNVKEYAEKRSSTSGCDESLWLLFDRRNYTSPVMRPLVVDDPSFPFSLVYGTKSFSDSYYLLSVVPEALSIRCGRIQGTAGTSPYREPGLEKALELNKNLQQEKLSLYQRIFERK